MIEWPESRRALVAIALSQLFALSVWFSTAAVGPSIETAWGLSQSQTTWLALAVQAGFVTGALGLALLGVSDAVPARFLFIGSALVAAAANAATLVSGPHGFAPTVALRFVVGVALAGVYPSGLKVMAGWFREGRGMALGVLVGALTVGSASPHLIRAFGFDFRGVLIAASTLAVLAAAMMAAMVTDGPYESTPGRFRWDQVGRVLTNRPYRLATYGYLGHMWELYAMWTWAAAWLTASAEARSAASSFVPWLTFAAVAIGGVGAWVAGVTADRSGRTRTASASLMVSGACAALTPLVFGANLWVVGALYLIWGFAIVADSAQFSAMVTELTPSSVRGTALTMQTALGFLLTLVTIRGVPQFAEAFGWRWAFPLLALGPIAGLVAMRVLRASPAASSLAGGRG